MLIDSGRYSLQGGSGIQDHFAKIGLLNSDASEYIARVYPSFKSNSPETSDQGQISGIMGNMIPKEFREMDFIFIKNNFGDRKKLLEIFLHLAESWLHYGIKKEVPLGKPVNLKTFNSENLILDDISKSFDKNLFLNDSEVESKEEWLHKFSEVEFSDLFYSGPFKSAQNVRFLQRILSAIAEANSEIWVAHMYIYSPEIVEKITKALNRGVKVTVITHDSYPGGSNKSSIREISGGIEEKYKKNFNAYIFNQGKIAYHKKVILVDDFIFSGSSNLSYKSMYLYTDYEINFEAKSKALAENLKKVFQEDIRHSLDIDDSPSSFLDFFKSIIWRWGARIWG